MIDVYLEILGNILLTELFVFITSLFVMWMLEVIYEINIEIKERKNEK